jgi:hypothetical protein
MLKLADGKLLVKLARDAIEHYLRTGERTPIPKASGLLNERRGVFVTLTKGEELRGCIGYPLPIIPLLEATRDAAISSATGDPRFSPVKLDELKKIKVEISVLTPPELIKVKNPKEYLTQVEVGKHGLVVERGGFSGLLLPQVPTEWGWDTEEFLSQMCMKAGLMPDCWLEKGTKISKFSAQIFSEETPRGKVRERSLGE